MYFDQNKTWENCKHKYIQTNPKDTGAFFVIIEMSRITNTKRHMSATYNEYKEMQDKYDTQDKLN